MTTLLNLLASLLPAAFPSTSLALGGFVLVGACPFLLARSVRRGCAPAEPALALAAFALGGFALAPLAADFSLPALAARAAAVALLAPLAAWLGAEAA